MRQYTVEFIGTFFLVLAISLMENSLIENPAVVVGLMYMAMLYFGARISGAHYNPAISCALWFRGVMPTNFIPGYLVAQYLGACVALLLDFKLTGTLFLPDVSPLDSIWSVCLIEILFTFVLAYIFLVVRTIPHFMQFPLYGLILGFTLVALATIGGLFNPAVAAAALTINALYTEGVAVHLMHNLLVYILSPIFGGFLAGCLFDFFEAPARGEFVGVDARK
jgi:glycerol uptake facilitator-like aquaporin